MPERRRRRSTPTAGRTDTPGSDPHGTSQDERDRLPDPQVHAGPDRVDDARALVAHHHRGRPFPLAVADVEVRVADARRAAPARGPRPSRGSMSSSVSMRAGAARLASRTAAADRSCSRLARPPALTVRRGRYGTYAGHHIAASTAASAASPRRSRATATAIRPRHGAQRRDRRVEGAASRAARR